MRRRKWPAVLLAVCLLLVSLSGCAGQQRQLRVTLVLKTETDVAEFLGMLRSGVERAAEERRSS